MMPVALRSDARMCSMSIQQARLRFEHLGIGDDFARDFADLLALVHRQLAQQLVGRLFAETFCSISRPLARSTVLRSTSDKRGDRVPRAWRDSG